MSFNITLSNLPLCVKMLLRYSNFGTCFNLVSFICICSGPGKAYKGLFHALRPNGHMMLEPAFVQTNRHSSMTPDSAPQKPTSLKHKRPSSQKMDIRYMWKDLIPGHTLRNAHYHLSVVSTDWVLCQANIAMPLCRCEAQLPVFHAPLVSTLSEGNEDAAIQSS